ncbi:hypothetical protein MSI_25480 [Treponema sp. JC4]|nr:hypothetical protein MSI_25480 [Treponema sp. JC4]
MPVLCVEHKTLARALSENTTEGDYIDVDYIKAVAKVYSKLPKFKNYDRKTFHEELNNDVVTQLYQIEADICTSAEKKYLQKVVKTETKSISLDDARELIGKNISKFSEEYGVDCRIIYNASKSTDEYYLETVIEEYDFDLWLMVMFSSEDQKIYVGNRSIFRSFDICEAKLVVDYVRNLIQITNGKLKRDLKIYCKEFKLNPRLYDIANNSIKTMLEMNYNRTGIEYGIDDSMKTQVAVYLKKTNLPILKEEMSLSESIATIFASGGNVQVNYNKKAEPMMYEVCITYNEFLRNPDAFKKFIEEPKIRKKWNFWSRRKKYRPEFFDKKFQPIAP